jgi:hypothetical protein
VGCGPIGRAKRALQREMLAAAVISAEAAAWFEQADARRARLTAWARCPGCGVMVWAGVRRRADAVFCSARCRVRAWRARRSGSGQQDDHHWLAVTDVRFARVGVTAGR